MLAVLAQAQGSYLRFGGGKAADAGVDLTPVYVGVVALVIVVAILIQVLRKTLGRKPTANRRNGRSSSTSKRARAKQRDKMREFATDYIDMDPLINPPTGRARPIPEELKLGTVLISQRLGVKCLLLDDLEEVSENTLKEICARKLRPAQALYIPMGFQVYKDEILHQGRSFTAKLKKGTLFTSVGGHPNAYLLDELELPLRKELSRSSQVLPITETTAQRYLQPLVEIPQSFQLLKEDVLFDASKENVRSIEKGTLIITRSGALVGLMLEDYQLPHTGPLSDLEALFQLKTNYERFPLDTLIQKSAKAGGRPIEIDKGTFIFSSSGKVYFVWKDDLSVDEQTLTTWSKQSQINHPCLLMVSKTKSNKIGGPGQVITQDELNYLRDVFREAGTTNINQQSLILDKNVFYKFRIDMPYAQSGKFRGYLGKGVDILNSASRGTFSVELGGKDIELTDLDIAAVREHVVEEGKMLIKIGTLLRIRDEKYGDWVYKVTTNLFYPYDTLTRPFMEEFMPESIRFDHREAKMSSIIGPRDPKDKIGEDDYGASGEPVGDLLAIINNQLFQHERSVFVLDGCLFNWRGRVYRVNEELVFRPHEYSDRLQDADFDALASDWKIHPVVEDEEEDKGPAFIEEEEDLEDLPFDTDAVR